MISPGESAAPPVIALLCTRGMEAFLANAVSGMLRTGIAPAQILVACPANAEQAVRSVISAYSPDISVRADPDLPPTEDGQYADFGSQAFSDICWAKIALIRRLIEQYEHVVYADLDIGWLRDPLPYLAQVAGQYPIAFQTEGLPLFPPVVCCGFISVCRSERAIAFLDLLLAENRETGSGKRVDDQAACTQIIARDPAWLKHIYLLPEALFINGLGYRMMQHERVPPDAMEAELQPFLFHANWTIGLDNKRKLLAMAHCWSIDDAASGEAAQGTPSRGGADEAPLVSILYPVFDVRGDVADHVRHWIDGQQGIAGRRFQLVVAASTDTPINEAALQKVLRPFDVLIRVPGARQDTELWNAAARASRAPWLLFVEAHGWPAGDALKALAEWIEANPDKRACNFRIRNPDSYRVARLMGRWFTQIQQGWALPTSWQRLHRTGFALRRDVFERVGPIEPFGQFGPALLSARLHQRGIAISTLPASNLTHEDAPDISVHIVDTADYARGELAARAALPEAEFFESYFGPSPFHGAEPILTATAAWIFMRALATLLLRQCGGAEALKRQVHQLLPSLVPLGLRKACLLARIRLDALLIMHMPLSEGLIWRRFTASHDEIVRVERMRWMARNPLPPIACSKNIPARELVQHAIIGLYTLEYADGAALRWTHPTCLMRLAGGRKTTVSIETRNLRPELTARDIQVVVSGASTTSVEVASSGDIRLQAEMPAKWSGTIDIVLIVPELIEPTATGPGRRLGLPVFGIKIEFA